MYNPIDLLPGYVTVSQTFHEWLHVFLYLRMSDLLSFGPTATTRQMKKSQEKNTTGNMGVSHKGTMQSAPPQTTHHTQTYAALHPASTLLRPGGHRPATAAYAWSTTGRKVLVCKYCSTRDQKGSLKH